MAAQVEETLAYIIAKEGEMTQDDARGYLLEMKVSGEVLGIFLANVLGSMSVPTTSIGRVNNLI